MGENVFTLLDNIIRDHPDREAVVDFGPDLNKNSLTFKQLWTLSARCAALLKEQGMRRHDNVMITLPLCLEYWVASFGVIFAGGAPVAMRKLTTDGSAMIETVRRTKSPFWFVRPMDGTHTWDMMKPFLPAEAVTRGDLVTSISKSDMADLQTAILVRRSSDGDCQGFLDILKSRSEEYVDRGIGARDPAVLTVTLDPNKLWCIKVIEISHGAMCNMARRWERKFPDWNTLYIPYAWYAGGAIPFDTLAGVTRQQPDVWQFGADEVKYLPFQTKLFGSGKVKNISVGPSDLFYIVETCKKAVMPFVENAIIGGGVLTTGGIEKCHKVVKNVYVMYMMSECLSCTLHKVDRTVPFQNYYAGKLEEGIQMIVLDEKHKEAPLGKPGMLAVKSDTLFTRYVGDEERNESAWSKDGWFLTHDTGYLRKEDGHLFVFGRQGDVISRDICLIPAKVLENPISQHPDIIEVKVVAVPDPYNGNNTCACVVLRPGSVLTSKDLAEYVADTMSDMGRYCYPLDYMVPFSESLAGKRKEQLVSTACNYLGINASK